MLLRLLQSQKFSRSILLLVICSLGLILFCIFFVDQRLAQFSADPENIKFWLFHREITEVGKSDPYFIISILLWLGGWLVSKIKSLNFIQKNRAVKWSRLGRGLLICLVTAGIALFTFKPFIGRLRPHKSPDFNPLVFDYFQLDWNWQSFPSGHSQTLFSVATYLSLMFPKQMILIYPIALYFAFTRAFTYAHFASDVIGGCTLGIIATLMTVRYLNRKQILTFSDLNISNKQENI